MDNPIANSRAPTLFNQYKLLCTLVSFIVYGASACRLPADILLSSGHVDFVAQFDGSTWTSFYEDEFGQIDLMDGVILAPGSAAIQRPANSSFDFLGVTAGEPVWVLPATPVNDLVWMGISTRTVGLQTSESTQLRLYSVVGPGHVSLWSIGSFGVPTPHWSSADGTSASDTLLLSNNTHTHLNWAFSQPGDYTLVIDVSGVLSNGVPTPIGQFSVQAQAVPEPTSLSLGIIAIATYSAHGLRRRRIRLAAPETNFSL